MADRSIQTPEDENEIIPGLPDIMALQCMIRIPPMAIKKLKAVNRRWRQVISGGELFHERKRTGITTEMLCLVKDMHLRQKPNRHKCSSYIMYDMRTRDVCRLPPLPYECQVIPGVVRCEGKLYFLCGRCGKSSPTEWKGSTKVFSFDCATERWNRCADLPEVTYNGDVFCATEGKIYVRSTWHSRAIKEWAQVHDVARDEWTSLPDPLFKEKGQRQGIIWNKKFFVLRRHVGHASTLHGDWYDPETCRWNLINSSLKFEAKFGPEEGSKLEFVVSRGKLYAISYWPSSIFASTDLGDDTICEDSTVRLWLFIEERGSWIMLGALFEHKWILVASFPLSDGDVLVEVSDDEKIVYLRMKIVEGGGNPTWSLEKVKSAPTSFSLGPRFSTFRLVRVVMVC